MSGEFMNDGELRQRFCREAQSAGRLQHANIVTVHELLEDEGTTYIVMELLEGASLYALIRKGNALDIAEKLSILAQVGSGLQHAHEHGIVHRDLKPSNVFVSRNGIAKIVDFGVAKFGESELTRAGTVFGTLEYMAPEQLQGKPVDARADVFSLGVVAYELLTGRNPFRAEAAAVSVFKVLSDIPETMTAQVKTLPMSIEEVVFRALDKKEDRRYQSAEEFVAQLRTAAHEADIEPRPPHLPEDIINTASRDSRQGSSAPQVGQWSNVAAVADRLDQTFRDGIECFAKEELEGCVSRMSEVLDQVPIHSMALHYLSQCEEKLRQQRLEPALRQETTTLLGEMRNAHRQGEPSRVIEAANRLLTIDAESMEARWYRRNAENRMTPASHTRGGSVVSTSRVSVLAAPNSASGAEPSLVSPNRWASTEPNRSQGMWIMAGAGILFVALIALAWGFGGSLDVGSSVGEARHQSPSKVRPSLFEDEEAVVVHVPTKAASVEHPSINSVLPKDLVAGDATTVRLFGSNFLADTRVLPASTAGDIELVAVKVVSRELIEATIRPSPQIRWGELSLFVMNPNGGRSSSQTLGIVSSDQSSVTGYQ
jgi:serine/threonine protein kinase